MGGPSAEHGVSLKSGSMVLKYLDPSRYKARGIVIAKDGKWPISLATLKRDFDLAFIAMHGAYGEDGTIQALLEERGIPFTGSGSVASRLGMDKTASSEAFQKAGLRVPGPAAHFPMVIKPANHGSSIGVHLVSQPKALPGAIIDASKYSSAVIVQEYIAGREFTCGVLDVNGKTQALPPTEIILRSAKFFDYTSKYILGASREITPPKLPVQKIKEIQRTALQAHRAIGAKGFSRTDIIMNKSGHLYVLEINTIPGMTATSLLPQQAAAAGMNFPKLLDVIVRGALRK